MNAAVKSAKEAYASWSQTSVSTRARVMFKLRDLVEKHTVIFFIFFQI